MVAPGPSPGSAWHSIILLAVAAAQPQRKDITIFYNVYMHNRTAAGLARTPVMIQQQLAAVKRSPAWPAVAEVRFATIGNPRGRETVLHACRKAAIGASKCVHLGHTNSGSEVTTLAPLHDFCRARPRALVAYLHVGFRWSPKTGALQRAALRGMASSACARALRGDTCDVCAMRFSPLPYAHVPANMWMARCAYVRDLAPPAEFRRLVDALWRGKACQHCFGHGRHALGHWVGSHPSLRACDTLAAPNAAPRPNFPLRLADAPRDRKNPRDRKSPCGMWGSHRKQPCQRTYHDVLEEWREIYGWVPASSRSRLKRYYLAQENPRPARRRLTADGAVVF